MLSFAMNYWFAGLDPWAMKAVNLGIHLFNGALLWLVLRSLLRLWNARRTQPLADPSVAWIATGIAAAWLVCPINLSPVLYAVQRMESLAQTFVLCGLGLYLEGRRRMLRDGRGLGLAASGLVVSAGLGVLCKESAVLLPLYAFLAEWALLRFESAGGDGRRALWVTYGALLFVPATIVLAWLLWRFLPGAAFSTRPFTLGQRLLTECRVLVDYIAWTLFPTPRSLGFYHDDILVSQGWLQPPATLICAALIAAALAAAVALRRRMPLLALGIAWYFAAHLLTATIIPLELVFEHRNYFASIGLLLAAAALLMELPPDFVLLRWTLPVLAIAAYSAETGMKAHEWSDPIHFAEAEAAEHPHSPRAVYELGRTLTVASGYREDSKLIAPAMQAFAQAAELPNSGAAASAGLILVANHMHLPIRPEWWQRLIAKLGEKPPSVDDIDALRGISACQRKGECAPEVQPLLKAFIAALSHPSPAPTLLAEYAAFCANGLHEYALAAQVMQDAVAMRPDNPAFRIDLTRIQLLNGNVPGAAAALAPLEGARLDQADTAQVAELKRQVQSKLTQPPGT
jgi:protein O-mannosyl-transferase